MDALPRKPDAIDRAIAGMSARAAVAVNALLDAMTEQMLAEPWRINRAVTGMSFWPPEDTLPDMLRWCRDSIADEVECARDGHYRRDAFKLETIRAAERALIRLGAEQPAKDAA